MKHRVVITGIGPVRSNCRGVEPFWQSICDLLRDVHPIPESYRKNYSWKSTFHVPAPKEDWSGYNFPPSLLRALDKTSKLTIEAAYLALTDAGFTVERDGKSMAVNGMSDAGTYIGVGVNNLHAAVVAQNTHMFAHDKELLSESGFPTRFPLMSSVNVMANAPSAWTSIVFGLRGENYCLNTACASGTFAIGEAFRKIRDGYVPSALAGGAECLEVPFGTTMRSFDTLGTLTKTDDGNPQPFSKNRSGFLFAEGGASLLVLESLDVALERGAEIYAEIVDYTANSDAYNIVQIKEKSESICKVLETLSKDKKIDYINTHGTATELNDKVEAEIIQYFYGDQNVQPLINSTKGILGHTIGASGAFEAAVTALSLKHQTVHGSDITDPIDNLNIVFETTSSELNYAISTSYGFGGHNAGLLFKRFEI